MKKIILLLVLFSLTTSAQTTQEKKLYLGYKSAGDKAFKEGKYSKAAAEYRKAGQVCKDCKVVNALIDSCNQRQRNALASSQVKSTPAPVTTSRTEDQTTIQAAEMGALSPHEQLTQFSNMKYNFVSSRVQTYMSKYMNMATDSDEVTDDSISLLFKEKSSYNGTLKELTFKFSVEAIGNDFVIKNCTVTGDYENLLLFYITYWNTKMNVDETKTGLVATTRFLQDDSKLYLNGNKSYIEVVRR